MTRELVFMFPGQSSRYPEMVSKLVRQSSACAAVVRDASEVLGRDVQVGVFLANHLHLVLAGAVTAPIFVEVGPKAVLYSLMGKQWQPGGRARTDIEGDTSAHLAALAEELGDAR